ncbi:CpsD/CapB family tyrosine-protein kinase [Albimonas pacifica]|uniref:Chromosome partitioning ATPase, Mrp family, contains Fe-S cluster n=1 Tax=Albimonas pacifica TaxID=1114924 RepID=A0A1I3IIH3_9RHOB|nr:CpsD/CapB family tyrosine-protein kinase [Albimonas pacifica]SFI47784.1 Chromosome partitioning ATPase, Mrp family, contains Fe-S cluster [Albimonas pacifica]
MALAVAAVMAALSLAPARYVAEAVVEVAARPAASWAAAPAAAAALDPAGIETERRLLLAPEALERVTRRLGLAATAEFGRPPGPWGARALIASAGVLPPAAPRPPTGGPPPAGPAPEAPAAAPAADPSEAEARVAEAARRLASRLSARRLGDSRLIVLRARSADPALAARIAAAVVDDRLQVQAEAAAREARSAATRLSDRLARLDAPGDAPPEPDAPVARGAGLAAALAAHAQEADARPAALPPPAPDARAAERAALVDGLAAARLAAATAAPEARRVSVDVRGRAAGPSPGLALSLALGGGLALGGALAWLRETGDGPPLSAAMAAADAGAPALAALPRARGRADPVETARRRPGSPLAEGARRLRQALDAGAETPEAVQVLAVLSPGPGEGRSTLAALLAESCARAGLRTALVDADLRAPSQARRCGADGATDLLAVLAGEATAAEALLRPEEGGPWLLPADPATARRAELLAGPAMVRLVEELRRRFDVVILDTPPLLHAAEARALAGLADRRLLAMRWGATRRGDLRAAAETLREAGAPASGLALLAAPRARGPAATADRPRYGGFLEGFDG